MTLSDASVNGVVAGHRLGGPVDVTDGGPDMVQFITADGKRAPLTSVNEPYAQLLNDLTPEQARAMYRDMVLVRRLDTEGYALQRQSELGLWAPCLGQEAAQIGAGHAMREQDYGFPGYREHGVAFVRGVEPSAMFGLYRGTTHGGWDPKKHRFNTFTIVIGNQMLNAVGYAQGVQMDGAYATGDTSKDEAVIAFTGDGGTSQGDFNEALVFASVSQAPIVFFIQNNGWAISEPNSRQFRVPPYKRADGFGFPGVRVDGNDALATFAVARRSLDNARAGLGPTLVEAFTYRMSAHTTSDDPSRYRETADVEAWAKKDPIDRLRKFLISEDHMDEKFVADVDAESKDLGAQWRAACRELTAPSLPELFEDVFTDLDPVLAGQRDEVVAYLDSFAEEGASA